MTEPTTTTNPSPRDASGRFRPGASGNPAGRPPGSGASPGTRLRRLIGEHGETIVGALVKKARDGDVQAALGLLDRVLPRVRPISEPITLDLAGSRQEIADRLLAAVSAGEIGSETAAELLALVGSAQPPDTSITPIDFDRLDELYNRAMQASDAEAARIEAEKLAGLRG